ncbi:MAG: DNA alkylation response protein, partial [Paraburkholderia caledonica]
LRAMEREPEAAQALFAQWQADAAAHPALSAPLGKLAATLNGPAEDREASARRIAQQIVLIAQATLLIKHAPAAVAEAFIATRLGSGCGESGRVYGTLPATFDHAAIIERAFPG